MRKLILFMILTIAAPLQILHAGPVDDGLTDYGLVDTQLYHAYWRLYNRLSPENRALLKANEMRWIDWKDTLPLNRRIQAAYDRIALLAQL